MNPANYKTKRKGQPKRNSPMTKSKSRMLSKPKNDAANRNQKLKDHYVTKIEWVTKRLPKIKA